MGILVAGLMWAIFCSLKLEPRAVVGRVLNFPALKILVLASGWTFSLAVLPALANSQAVSAGWMVSIFFAFGLIFFRTGLMELRDIQGDRIVGKRTLPIVFGKVQTETLMGVICAALAVTLVSACINEWVTPSFGYLMLIPVMYAGACLYWYTRKILGHSGLMEVAADQIFIIAGVLALLMV